MTATDMQATFDAYYAENWPLCKASIEKGTASEEITDEREALWDTWQDAWKAALASRPDAQADEREATQEFEQMTPNQRRAVSKGLAALETMADLWAVEVRLAEMSQHIAAVEDQAERAKRIEALIHLGFVEGAYRHFLDHKDAQASAAAAPSPDREQVGEAPLDLAKTFKQWVRDHEAELNSREYSRIDRALDQFIMALALRNASPSRERGERQVPTLCADERDTLAILSHPQFDRALTATDKARLRRILSASAPTLSNEQINLISEKWSARWSTGSAWNTKRCIDNALREACTLIAASAPTLGDGKLNLVDRLEDAMRAHLGPKYCPPSGEPDDSFLSPVLVVAPQSQAVEPKGMTDEQRSALLAVLECADTRERHRTNQAWINLREAIDNARALLAAHSAEAQADERAETTLYGAPCGDFCARAAASQETPVALAIKEDERDGNWREFSVNGHGGFIRIVARMEDDEADLPLSAQVARFLLSAPRPTATALWAPHSGCYEFRDTGPLETGDA